MNPNPQSETTPNRDRLLFSVLLLLGLWAGVVLRLDGAARTFLWGDEYHSLDTSRLSCAEILGRFDDKGSHVPLPLLQHVSCRLFGSGLLSLRLPAVVAGILALLVCFPVMRRFVGAPAALLATWALALNPMHVFYSHFGRSYSIAGLFVLLLAAAFVRAEEGGRRAPWHGVAAAVLIALALWTHLSAAGVVAGLSLSFLYGALSRGRADTSSAESRAVRWGGVPRVAVLAAGTLLALLLYLPVWGQVSDYLHEVPLEERTRPSGPFGVVDVLAGGRIAGLAWFFLLAPAAMVVFTRSRDAARWLVPAVAGSVAFLLAFRPHGQEFAWSRYLLVALPFLTALLASLVVALSRRLVPDRSSADRLAVTVGLAALAAVYLTGPLSPRRPDVGPFANTYLAMKHLPAFDVPFAGAPELYRRIASDSSVTCVLEVPPRAFRPLLLYRSYFRIHGKTTYLAGRDRDPSQPSPPYFDVEEVLARSDPPADYLILHRDIMKESNDYWDYVYTVAWPGHPLAGDSGFMSELDRPKRPWHPPSEEIDEMAAAFTTRFGEPAYEDDALIAWDLRRRGVRSPGAESDAALGARE